MPANHLIYLEDSTLVRMANDARFAEPFPWLLAVQQAQAQAQPRTCGSCGRRQAAAAGADAFAQARLTIAQLPDAQKIQLKQLLDTQQLRVIYRRPTDGAMIKLTF